MNIYVSQIYIEVGVNYPFSHLFQIHLGKELTKRITPSDAFVNLYGEDFDLIFRMSAKADLKQPEIKEPTVFKKDKDVEISIFLTFDKPESKGPDLYRRVLSQFIDQVVIVLMRLEIDAVQLIHDSDKIVEIIVTDPKMINSD